MTSCANEQTVYYTWKIQVLLYVSVSLQLVPGVRGEDQSFHTEPEPCKATLFPGVKQREVINTVTCGLRVIYTIITQRPLYCTSLLCESLFRPCCLLVSCVVSMCFNVFVTSLCFPSAIFSFPFHVSRLQPPLFHTVFTVSWRWQQLESDLALGYLCILDFIFRPENVPTGQNRPNISEGLCDGCIALTRSVCVFLHTTFLFIYEEHIINWSCLNRRHCDILDLWSITSPKISLRLSTPPSVTCHPKSFTIYSSVNTSSSSSS